MKWQSFENKVNKELSGHRSEVDVDALWKAIEPKVNAINRGKRKKRRGMFWLLFTGLLLLGSGIGFYLLNNNNDKNIAATNVIENNISDKKSGLNKNKNNEPEISEQAIHEIKTNKSTTENIEVLKNKELKNAIEKNAGLNKNTPSQNVEINNNISNKKTNNTAAEEITDFRDNKNNSPQNTRTDNIASAKIDLLKNNTIKNVAENNSELNKNKIDGSEIPASIILNKKTNSTAASGIDISKNNKSKIVAADASISKLPLLPISAFAFFKEINFVPEIVLPNANSPAEAIPENAVPPPPGHPSNKKAYFISAEIIGGIAFANRQLGSTDSLSGTLKSLREKSETSLETVQLGLRLNLRHKSGLEFTSGLNYTRINERFDYDETIVKVDSVWGVAKRVLKIDGDTLDVFGDVPLISTTSILKKHHNSYTMLDIPVLVGYRFESGDWLLGAQAGIFANISMKAKGQFLSDESTAVPIDNLFKNKVGLSYYLGLSASYQLNDQMALSLSPHFRYFPSNFAAPSYALSQKYVLFGLNAGVRFQF